MAPVDFEKSALPNGNELLNMDIPAHEMGGGHLKLLAMRVTIVVSHGLFCDANIVASMTTKAT